jgi:hypothetical protein
LALAVPLSRFTPRVGGGSAFFVRHRGHALSFMSYVMDDAAKSERVEDLAATFRADFWLVGFGFSLDSHAAVFAF